MISLSSYGEPNSINYGGDSMKERMQSFKRAAWLAVLSGAMVTTLSLTAFGQQEVDPTWFDPWAPTAATVQHQDQQAAAPAHHTAKIKQVSSTRRMAKANSKHSANRPRPS
jgi:hypothetical protein